MGNTTSLKQTIVKILFVYLTVFLFFMAVLSKNELTSGLIVNIFSTIAFCVLGGLIPFAIADNYKSGYKYALLFIGVVGFLLSLLFSWVFYVYVPGLIQFAKAILFLGAFLSVTYLVCDNVKENFTFLKFEISVKYFKWFVVIFTSFLSLLLLCDSYIISISWYGVLIGFGFLFAMVLFMGIAKHRGIKADSVIDLALWVFPFSIIGARTYYILFTLNEFEWTFWDIFAVWKGGLAIYGGIIGGAIGLIVCCLVKKLNIIKVMDLAGPCLILGQAIGRIGCYFAHCCYGVEVSSPALKWFPLSVFIESKGAWFLSTFFYETALSFIGCLVLIYLVRKFKTSGMVVSGYFIWYGLERFLIEGLRGDSLFIGSSNIRVSQLLSLILFVVGIIWFVVLFVKYNGKNKNNEEDNKA